MTQTLKKSKQRLGLKTLKQCTDAELKSMMVRADIEGVLGKRSLKDYAEICWNKVEPGQDFIRGKWHVEAIADHLEALHRGDIKRLAIAIPPGHGKPQSVDMLVLMSDGIRKRLGDISVGDKVITHKGRSAKVITVHEQGELDVLEIETICGRKSVTESSHGYLTPDGWKQAKDLKIDECLLNVHQTKTKVISKQSLEEYRLAGYFVGDGSCTEHTPKSRPTHTYLKSSITCFDSIEEADIYQCCDKLGFKYKKTKRDKRTGRNKNVIDLSGGVRNWLRAVKLAGKNSHTKKVPDFVLQGSNEGIAHFLGAYFACDEYLNKKEKVRKDLCIEFTTVSKQLAEDTQHCLLRLGIQSRIREKSYKYKDKIGICYVTTIHGIHEAAKFYQLIPIFHEKQTRLAKWGPTKTKIDHPVYLSDKIKKITPAGKKLCRCITVSRDSSFLSNDFVVHNSVWAAVMFPTWVWTRTPNWRMLYGSFGYNLSERDAGRCSELMDAAWWQLRFGGEFKLKSRRKSMITNTMGGIRAAVSIGGDTTGKRGDLIAADDPLKIDDAESEAERATVKDWWDYTMCSRIRADSKRLVIMQRLHDDDLIGHLLSTEGEVKDGGTWTYLMLPAEYEKKRHCVTFTSDGCKFWEDPRTEEGDVLFPEQYPAEFIQEFEQKEGSGKACTPAESPVLMADLTHKNISTVKPGDVVVGFTKAGEGKAIYKRTLTRSIVLATHKYENAGVVKITLASGRTIRCTREHKWFTGRPDHDPTHKAYAPISGIGTKLLRLCDLSYQNGPENTAIKASWLSGLFDGDGSYSTQGHIVFIQGSGNAAICNKLEETLNYLDFNYADCITPKDECNSSFKCNADVHRYEIRTGRTSLETKQKFVELVKPTKWKDRIIDSIYGKSDFIAEKDRVVNIEPDGFEDVYALETTTGNYVVWGYASSNSSMYRQDPVKPGGEIIKTAWVRYYGEDPETIYDKCSRVIQSWDTAIKAKDTSSWTVGQVWGVRKGRIYLLDQVRIRGNFGEVKRAVMNLKKKWPRCKEILVEDKANGPDIIDELKEHIFGMIPAEGNDDKEARMHVISWLWEGGSVYVPGRPPKDEESDPDFTLVPWMKIFFDEITRYPKTKWTDQACAMSQAMKRLGKFFNMVKAAPTPVKGPGYGFGGGNIATLRDITRRMY